MKPTCKCQNCYSALAKKLVFCLGTKQIKMFFYSINTSSVAEAESYFVGAAAKMLIRIAKNAQKYGVWIENPVLGVSGLVSALSQINFKNFRSLAALLYRIMLLKQIQNTADYFDRLLLTNFHFVSPMRYQENPVNTWKFLILDL